MEKPYWSTTVVECNRRRAKKTGKRAKVILFCVGGAILVLVAFGLAAMVIF